MTSLVIHVGPGKCGSSTIQRFFETNDKPCFQNVKFKYLNPSIINELNDNKLGNKKLTDLIKPLFNNITQCDVLILSHEYLFQCLYAIKNICDVATHIVSGIIIIGYCRRQSDFMVSAYNQWLFRSSSRVMECSNELMKIGLNPILFSGLERQLISSISNDFYSARQLSNRSILNWYRSYLNLSKLTQASGAIVKVGVLPNKEAQKPLIQDFCDKSGLVLYDQTEPMTRSIANTSFNHDFIEAINIAVTLGFDVSEPHEDNISFHLITKIMNQSKAQSKFLFTLKEYIDFSYSGENNQLCNKYNLPIKYFTTEQSLDKTEVLDVITQEASNRSLDTMGVIIKYRALSAIMATTCFKIAKN